MIVDGQQRGEEEDAQSVRRLSWNEFLWQEHDVVLSFGIFELGLNMKNRI